MKNILLPLVLLLAIATTQAQRNNDRQENRREIAANMDPAAIASIQAKKMTLALDLTDKQEREITEILVANKSNRDQKITREQYQAMSAADKLAVKEKKMDAQIATKRAFKEILNDDQYERFEKMAKNRRGKQRGERQKIRRG